MVDIRPVTRENWRETLQLGVLPDQQRFVSEHKPISLVGLAKAQVGAGGFSWIPFVFYLSSSLPIGFAMAAFESGDPGRCWIFHFLIDSRYQGRGYGAVSLKVLLATICKSANCHSILLTVHPENTAAMRLYSGAGFVNTGEHAFGEPVFECLVARIT